MLQERKSYSFGELIQIVKSGVELPENVKGNPRIAYENLKAIAADGKTEKISREEAARIVGALREKYNSKYDSIAESEYVKMTEEEKMRHITTWRYRRK